MSRSLLKKKLHVNWHYFYCLSSLVAEISCFTENSSDKFPDTSLISAGSNNFPGLDPQTIPGFPGENYLHKYFLIKV